MGDAALKFLHEAGGELVAGAAKRTRRDTGDTANRWSYTVDERAKILTVGNPLENAVWEEFGTGEYALGGNGRRGGWTYRHPTKGFVRTRGKKPSRAFYFTYREQRKPIQRKAENIFRGVS